MTPQEAVDLAARTLAAIDEHQRLFGTYPQARYDADRERVASDLAGVCLHDDNQRGEWIDPDDDPDPSYCTWCTYDDRAVDWPCLDARRYSAGLVRTARLYGCEVPQ